MNETDDLHQQKDKDKAIKLLLKDFKKRNRHESLPKALGNLFTKEGVGYLIGSQQIGTKTCFIKKTIQRLFPNFKEDEEEAEEEVDETLEEYNLVSSCNLSLQRECQLRNSQELSKWLDIDSSHEEETLKFLSMLLVSLVSSSSTLLASNDSDFDVNFGSKAMYFASNEMNQFSIIELLCDYAIHFGFSIGMNEIQNNTHLNHLMKVCAPFIKKTSRKKENLFIKIEEKGEEKSFEHYLIFMEHQHDACTENPLSHKDFRKMIVLLRSSIKKNIYEKIAHSNIQQNSVVTSFGILSSLNMVFVIEMNGILNVVDTDSVNVGISYHLSLVGRFDITTETGRNNLKKQFKSIMTTHSQTRICTKSTQKFKVVSTPYYSKTPSSTLRLVNFQDLYNVIRLTQLLPCEFSSNTPFQHTIEITHETFYKDSQFFVKPKGRISTTILRNYKKVYSILGTDQNNATLIWFFSPTQKRTVRSNNSENDDCEPYDENPKPSKSQHSTHNTEVKQSHNTSSSPHTFPIKTYNRSNAFSKLKEYLQQEFNIKIFQSSFSKRMKQEGITICGKGFPLGNILKTSFIKISLYYNSNRTENEDLMKNLQKDNSLENVCSIINYEKKTIPIFQASELFENELPKQSSYEIYITTMMWYEDVAEFCLSSPLKWFRDTETRISTLNSIIEQIKKGINNLHAKSIIHCDICISNILISAYFKPLTRDLTINTYFTDFNHAKYETQDCSLVLFKPAYTPTNELLIFKKEHDWYACGIVIAQLIHLFSRSYEEEDLFSNLQEILRDEGNPMLFKDAFSRITHLENELDYSALIKEARSYIKS